MLIMILLSGLTIFYLWNKREVKIPVETELVQGDTLKIYVPGKRDTTKTIRRLQNKSVLRPLIRDKGNLIYTDTLKNNQLSIATIITRSDTSDEIILDYETGVVSLETFQTDTIRFTITDTLKLYIPKNEERLFYDNYLTGFLTALLAGIIIYFVWE